MNPSGALFAPFASPPTQRSGKAVPWGSRHCRTKFVKNQYKFACDFKFVPDRCKKATETVNNWLGQSHTPEFPLWGYERETRQLVAAANGRYISRGFSRNEGSVTRELAREPLSRRSKQWPVNSSITCRV
jgi:hypothetical protein